MEDCITLYFDHRQMRSLAKPERLKVPVYFIAHLAAGGRGDARDLGLTSLDAVLSHAVANGTSTIITADNGKVITLQNVNKALLMAHDFVF